MKLTAAIEWWESPLFCDHNILRGIHAEFPIRKKITKMFNDQVLGYVSMVWGRLAFFSLYRMKYTSLTFGIFCLDKGVHFTYHFLSSMT